MKYFHAGLKAEDKAQLSEDRLSPTQTVRQIVRSKTIRPIADATLSTIVALSQRAVPSSCEDAVHHAKNFFQLTFAYGDANRLGQVCVCAEIARSLQQPHTVINIDGAVFRHHLMVLTQNPLGPSDIPSQRYKSISDFSPDWVVVDPWMKIVCRGDKYKGQVYDKLGRWQDNGKVLLNKDDRTAWPPRSEAIILSFITGSLSVLAPEQ